jgi:hypothetical protein
MRYEEDFFKLLEKIKKHENFAFTRFSDGEVFVMQNKELILAKENVRVGETVYNFGYDEEDHKHFDPSEHGFLKDALLDAYKFKKDNYFVGGICSNCTCASRDYKGWMQEQYGEMDENYMTTNLLVNSNYSIFISQMLPEIKKRELVIICNEKATFPDKDLKIKKHFKVGKNCIVNDWHLIEEISSWIEENDIENCLFLFSASSLSEVLIHKLYDKHGNNTYIDVGTTMNKSFGLSLKRDYLKSYWLNGSLTPDIFRKCEY